MVKIGVHLWNHKIKTGVSLFWDHSIGARPQGPQPDAQNGDVLVEYFTRDRIYAIPRLSVRLSRV